MKISLKWLNEYVDVDDYFTKPEELADLLTHAGLEVDEIEDLSTPYKNVVIGTLLEVGKHPDADRLTVCQVSTGEGVVHQIVCGAKNHKTGDRVVAALPGAVLPGDFTIKKSKLRGVESAGMLCSEKELQLSEEAEGIMILDDDAPIGQNFAIYYGLDDVVFEINVTPNRADCLSHLGLAREIAAILGREVHTPAMNLNRVSESTKDQIKLELIDSDRCPRYGGCYARNVKVGPSPKWLQQRLEKVGINSINNVVDITNFVLMELGQPLHAFDIRFLDGKVIKIDGSKAGESFKTLDGTDLKLDGTELTIRDSGKPVALAGVVGGENSGVQDDTTEVFIESAYFRPKTVRTTSRKFGFETDSSYRFARGVNPEAIPFALERACQLLQDICGAEVYSDPYDLYPEPIEQGSIEIAVADVAERMGFEVKSADFQQWMIRLGCNVLSKDDGERFVITPPAYRADISIPEDLVEEFGRLYGYEHIPDKLTVLQDNPTPNELTYSLERVAKESLVGLGFYECFNYAFLNEAFQKKVVGDVARMQMLNLDVAAEPIELMNPLNEEYAVMRTSLIPHMIKNIEFNLNHSNEYGKLFEIGKTFSKTPEQFKEQGRIAFGVFGRPEGLWNKGQTPAVYELKSSVESLLTSLKGRNWHWSIPGEPRQVPEFIHPGQVAFLTYEGKTLGYLGTLHPALADEFKIKSDVALGEFNLDLLFEGQPRTYKYKKISKFPGTQRDLAFLVPDDLPAETVAAQIRKSAGKLCQAVEVFDVYKGDSLQENQRSIAFRMYLQDQDSTLEDKQISSIQEKVVKGVTEKLNIQVR